jgi:hypothetical protein
MCQTPIDEQVRQISEVAYNGASVREIAVAIEANQAYIEYLDFVKDNMPPADGTVTIEVDGTRVTFKNEDDFTDWLEEQMNVRST